MWASFGMRRYYQCKPVGSPTPAPTAAPTGATAASGSQQDGAVAAQAVWAQCGGKSSCPAGAACEDAPWAGGCAAPTSCTRQNEWYWQCL